MYYNTAEGGGRGAASGLQLEGRVCGMLLGLGLMFGFCVGFG